ncbi:Gfo/Idh/MocA family protein [Pseudomonas monteilii]|uniref:Gfo/Idh/MocA family protein n=1 Tax=Pseudomonas monteilii TaxID=76759 RepID=UPI003D057CFD
MKWGLIGASNVAREWMIDAIRAVGDEVVAVVSSNADRGAVFANTHDIPGHETSVAKMLTHHQIDAVYISTHNHLHKEQTLQAVETGKHVLCEKPLALTVADAEQMVEAAREAGVVLATNHHLRNAATHRRMRQAISDGLIGKPIAARVLHAAQLPPHLQGWRVNAADGGGVVLDMAVHDIDTLRYLLQDNPVEVTAFTQIGEMSQNNVPDAVMGVIRFSSGVIAQFHDAFTVPYAQAGMEIIGTHGTLIAQNVMTQRPVGEVRIINGQGARALEVSHGNLYEQALRQFQKAVQGLGEPAVSGEDGVWSLATGLALIESAAEGRAVRVPYNPIGSRR